MALFCLHSGTPDRVFVFPEDTANDGTPSGSNVRDFNLPSVSPESMTIDGDDLYIASRVGTGAEVIVIPADTADGTTLTDSDIIRRFDLPSGLTFPRGMAINGNDLYISDQTGDEVFVIPADTADGGTAVASRRFDLPSNLTTPLSMTIDGDDLYIADSTDDEVFVIPANTANDGTAVASRRFNLPTGLTSPQGMTIDGNDLYVADFTGTEVFVIPADTANNGTAVASRRFNLPSGLTDPRGLAFQSSQATLTLSTADTDIRAGEPVDIEIDSDIDISNFVASDITVTGGTRGALTINSVTSATLRVTAGSAGTMTVAIAADAVDPGNAAASEDFTVNARVTATITFDDSEGESGGSTGVNIDFGESVTDLRLSDLSTTAGTLSLVTGSGTSWAATLAFPATGSGTATVSLAEDSTTPQNASASATIDYAEAAVALALGWTVPTAPVGNTFSATLTSNHPITGVELNDFRFRISDNSEGAVALTAANTTLTAVAGTNNWRLDIVLVGTFDADYTIRLRGNTVQYDGSNYPPAFLFSDAFAIDSSLDTPDDAVLNITLDATTVENSGIVNATFTFDSAVGGRCISRHRIHSGRCSRYLRCYERDADE